MLTLKELACRISPTRAVLLLGAGASVPSGAPSGTQLAGLLWTDLVGTNPLSHDLVEVASILENRFGRRALIASLRRFLLAPEPVGMLNELPRLGWPTIYTTNFDLLVEKAYQLRNEPLTIISSNHDYGKTQHSSGAMYFKIHGCITTDVIDGHYSRMILTERDFKDHERYRQVLFSNLRHDLLTKDAVIVGQSLTDPHLRRTLSDIAHINSVEGGQGKTYVVVFERDEDRARLIEDRGLTVVFGGIDEFIAELGSGESVAVFEPPPSEGASLALAIAVRAKTIVPSEAATLLPRARDLFSGRAASYSDIAAGLTFARKPEARILQAVTSSMKRFITIIGTAGVGKTTLARRIVWQAHGHGWLTWEHKSDLPLAAADWFPIAVALKALGKKAILLVDECTESLGQVNRLADYLVASENQEFCLLLTATRASWTPRVKTPPIYEFGEVVELSRLDRDDIIALLGLAHSNDNIRELMNRDFLALARGEQLKRLQERCASDMYVCLKNLFSHESLDTILLREFAALSAEQRDVYRLVCLFQAAAEHVHRQLVLRVSRLETSRIPSLLNELAGLVNEYDINQREGIYGWATRHSVIAEVIARYEAPADDELFALLGKLIGVLVPTVPIELMAMRAICSTDYGIRRLIDPYQRLALYRKLLDLAPGERIFHHRLVRELLELDDLNGAERSLKHALEIVREDAPLGRYGVRLKIKRALQTKGILHTHRRAMLIEARAHALRNLRRHPLDKYEYRAYGEVGIAHYEVAGEMDVLDDAIERMTTAATRILEPEIFSYVRELQQRRQYLLAKSPP